jgi:prepilin-type N-terminal cleavage/methylation domain-containing protein
MTLNRIKTMKKERGFTIVELLIVIVVIAILAAITIVAYNGVTNRANLSKAQTNAVSVQKVAEAYNADTGRYPGLTTDFTTGSTSTKLPTAITVVSQATALTATSGPTTVTWAYVGSSATTATGGRITYWDATTNAVSTNIIYVGNATSGSTFVNPAS